jgi:hypothetical protein
MAESTATRVRVARDTARDQLGHWVAPPSARAHPCPHACCRNKRVHPANLPVRLDRKYLRSLNDDELETELITYQRYNDTHERGFLQVLAEIGRRDDAGDRALARKEKARERRQRVSGEYSDEVYRQWLRAENGIQGGVLLNKAGIKAGISDRSLFSGSQARFNRYASDELKEWVETHPRMTRREYDSQRRAEEQAQRELYGRTAA